MDEKALGHRLQLARKRANLTQQELCQKAGLSYSTLAKIERGAIRSPSVFTVAAIANATNTPLENLLELTAAGPAQANAKKRSKSGVTFVYFDVNGTLVRFYHKAFGQIAQVSGRPPDVIETLYWRHQDAVATGQITLDEFNSLLAKDLGLDSFDWQKYYMNNVEPTPDVKELVEWTAQHYEAGLFSNNLPGFIDIMRQNGTLPNPSYKTVVDSSKIGLLKPDPKAFEKAQELAGVSADEILLVDDSRPNLIAADKLGWHVLEFDELEPAATITLIKQALEF